MLPPKKRKKKKRVTAPILKPTDDQKPGTFFGFIPRGYFIRDAYTAAKPIAQGFWMTAEGLPAKLKSTGGRLYFKMGTFISSKKPIKKTYISIQLNLFYSSCDTHEFDIHCAAVKSLQNLIINYKLLYTTATYIYTIQRYLTIRIAQYKNNFNCIIIKKNPWPS